MNQQQLHNSSYLSIHNQPGQGFRTKLAAVFFARRFSAGATGPVSLVGL